MDGKKNTCFNYHHLSKYWAILETNFEKMAMSPELVGASTMRGRRKFRGLRVNSISASAGAAVIVTIFLRLSRTASMEVLDTGTPASVRAVKVFVNAASCELSVHCGTVKKQQ